MEFDRLCILSWPEADEEYRIQNWYVYNREEYEIDRSMPVWTGEMPDKEGCSECGGSDEE